MATQNISKQKMQYFHTKWRDDHTQWLREADRWKQQHAETYRMLEYLQDRIDDHEMEMSDFEADLEDHDIRMEQDAKDAEFDSEIDGIATISMEDHMQQVQLHDKHRQQFLEMKQDHDFLFKLLKKLFDAIDV